MSTQPADSYPEELDSRYSAKDYSVFRYFIEKQKNDPEFWDKLADELWSKLSSEEQVVRTALNASFFPNNLEDRERSIKVGLVRDYIDRQIADTRALNEAWGNDGLSPVAPMESSET